ncbi:MAG: alpha/beta hydrolase fold domain-containing protein [Cryobacterium sp.]|nr:alpha/beta hydrolase fold domain-containing protein [Cryobacterium sp.]
MRKSLVSVVAVGIVLGLAACAPTRPASEASSSSGSSKNANSESSSSTLYLRPQPNLQPTVTPSDQGIVWGYAQNIDENYGEMSDPSGRIYPGTKIESKDPRPALVDGKQPLRMWIADPGNRDSVAARPAILWFHGGGFAKGLGAMYNLAEGAGKDYAKRGYVSISVEYRIDTSLVEKGSSSTALCQWVQDFTGSASDPTYLERRAHCNSNIDAALQDALAAIRYVRAHASELGVDPNKIVVGGFSAGGVIAYETAFSWDQVGDSPYFNGDNLSAADSRPQAVIGASGTIPPWDDSVLSQIGPDDVPTSFIASRFDPAVNYKSTALTVTTARTAGLVAELTSYCDESLHAERLYEAHPRATDDQWTTFLARQLGLNTNVRESSANPLCSN